MSRRNSDVPAWLVIIAGCLVSGFVIDWRLKRRDTISRLEETVVAAAAFVVGSFLAPVLLIGAFMIAFMFA